MWKNNVAYGSTYKYDAKGRITREDMVKQYSEPEGYYTYAYDAEGKLQAFTYYAYDPAEKKFAFASRNVCEYVNAKQLKAMYNYTRVNGKEELTSTTEYTYTDGNMTKATRYDGNKHKIRETTLIYDDQKNFITALPAYRAIMVLNGFPHEHNILSQIVTDAAGDTVTSQSYIRNMTYTDRGYLQRSTSTFLNGRVQQYTYTYDCD